MKKLFVFIMSIFLLVGCKGINVNVDETQAPLTPAVSKENNIMDKMEEYSKAVIKDFTKDYEQPLNSINYSYDVENDEHNFELENHFENGMWSRYINDKLDETKPKSIDTENEPIPEEILKNMDKIYKRALEDFNKKYENQKNIHFRYWSLYEDNGKYMFNGIIESDKNHPWDIYYNVERDIGIKY